MAKAIWNGQVIAESDETIIIEGNVYFPPNSIKKEFFTDSETTSQCMWKGTASYYNIEVAGETNKDAAWYYAEPKEGSEELVAKQNDGNGAFANYIAFWKGVEIQS